ncbi:MAG: hypothetical protein SWO11_12095 [Thermodesulfobacteriota bacterium]|nr:hypothetical protein [Thermodesulfobacteriota bacterium]
MNISRDMIAVVVIDGNNMADKKKAIGNSQVLENFQKRQRQ